jgi:VCBS repeat-containing protein
MNAPIVVAQANSSGSTTGTGSVRNIKVTKPSNEQAVTIQLGYDQAYKLDLSSIANEKITLVHIGEKLIILFENKSTVTVEPFFDSMNAPLSNVTVEANGRDFTGSEFASSFPITTDQSVLTAAGVSAAGTPSSGADFHGPSVDPLDVPHPLPLLGQEDLGNFVTTPVQGINLPPSTTTFVTTPLTLVPAVIAGTVDEGGLFPSNIGTFGNDFGAPTSFTGDAGNGQTLMNAVSWGSSGPSAVPFQFTVGTGDSLTGLGMFTHLVNGTVVEVDTALVSGNTLTAFAGGVGGVAVFKLTLNTDGSWTFKDLSPINHLPFGDNLDTHNQFDLSSLIKTVAADSSSLRLEPNTLAMTITDDVPVLRVGLEEGKFQSIPQVTGLVDEGGLTTDAIGTAGNDPGASTTSVSGAGSLNSLVAFGADGPNAIAAFQFAVGNGANLTDLGMFTHKADGTVVQVDTASISGDTLTAYSGGTSGIAVFTLSVHSNGSWTFTDLAPINHVPFADNGDNGNTFDLSSLVKAVDFDGDTVQLSHDFKITIIDDVPMLSSAGAVIGTVDEGGLTSDAIGTIGSDPGAPTTTAGGPGLLNSLVNFGTDGPNATAPFQFAVADGGNLSSLGMFTHKADGTVVQVDTASISGDTLTAYAGGTSGIAVFTGTIHSDGSASFTLLAPIQQAPGINDGDNSNTFDLSGLVKAVDFDGDSVQLSGDLKIIIIDDVPTAVADTNWVKEDTNTIATGNVFQNLDHPGAPVGSFADHADVAGADGIVTWSGAAGGSVTGLYGTVTVAADGSYTYVLDSSNSTVLALTNGQTLQDPFTYTITDADGDTSTVVSTITIFGTDHGVTIINLTPAANGGDASVNEANLLDGSAPNAAALTQTGTFNISAPDGFGNLTIGGVNVVTGGSVTLPGLPITTTYGQLTITDINLSTGVVSYSYKLTTNALVSGTATFDNVSVHLADTDTSFADSTLSIKVVDDAPVAHADTDSAQSGATATGNVVTGIDVAGGDANATDGIADTLGADGAAVSGVVAGNSVGTPVTNGAGVGSAITTGLGTLTLNSDGSYHYVAKSNVSGTDTFTYTLKDGDGDTSTTTLTIVVSNGAPLPSAATGTVDEAGLTSGSTPSAALTHTSGTLTLGDPDSPHVTNIAGVTSSAVGGAAVNVNGLYGTLQIDQNGNYTYTLTSNDPHHTTQGTGIDGQTDVFTYTVTDSFGNAGTNTITISIKDDVPTAGFTLASTTVTIDESAGIQSLPANDHPGPWPLTTPAGAGTLMGWAQSAGSVIGSDTSKGGADGKASVTYAFTTAGGGAFSGVDSGLSATATGNKIWLFTEGNLVVGREGSGAGGVTTNAGGAVAFAIGLGVGNNLDLAQYEAIKHSNASDPNDTASITSGLLHLTQTVTDGDGDKATSTNAAGLSISFTDDGPTAPTVVASAATVAVDETPGVQAAPAKDIAGSTTITFNGASNTVANLFSTVANKGVDADVAAGSLDNGALSFAASGANMVTVTGGGFGVDGPAASGATTYALTVANLASGLTLTDGTAITLSLDGSGRVIGTVGSDAVNSSLTGKVAFALTIDPQTGQAYVAQYLSLHQPDTTNSNDAVSLAANTVKVTVTFKDGDGDTITSVAGDISSHISFLDDGPSANAVTKSLVPAGHDTNIMLILDVSGSMGDASGLTGLTRLSVLKAAVNELFEQYGDLGNVRVQILQFSTSASQVGTDWMTIAQAKAAVNVLSAGGNTNYDAAVSTAESIFIHSGVLTTAGVQNVSYFMSDGVPNLPSGSVGINASEEATWTTFLNTNHIDSFALGIGTGTTQSALDPLAYNGVTHTNTNATIVTDLSQLTQALVGTIAGTGGNILTDGGPLPGSFGADGGFVKSITADGTTYTYNPTAGGSISVSGGANHGSFDPTTHTETVTLASGGVLTMIMDNGTYSYAAPANVSSGFTDAIPFVLIDNDGDTAGNTLTVVVSTQDHHPIVRDDHVITNITGGNGANIVIPDWALLFNDSDPEGQAIAITGTITNISSANSVTHASGNVTFVDNNTTGGSFTYTGSTTSPAASDTGDVTVDRSQTGSTLTGTGLDDILIGRNGTNNIINGNEGNDVLIAGNGNDSLNGGAGNDLLVGGTGKDTFVYNAVTDSTIASHDTIMNFVHGQDIINFTNISGILASGGHPTFQGNLGSGGGTLNVGSVGYIENNGNTEVVVNTSAHSESVSATGVGANMMILLTGINLNLSSSDLHHT